jgi:hypothetical protein
MLSLAAPASYDSLDAAVSDLLDARLRVTTVGPARRSQRRVPVRMPAPRVGLTAGTGWLCAVTVPVQGEPQPDALLDGCEVLTFEAALASLPTELERILLRDAAVLGGDASAAQ